MSFILRGKKTSLTNFTDKFTKVPYVILHADNKLLSPVDKLILIELHSYSSRPNYIVPYTRIAKDLHIARSNMVVRWNRLLNLGFIFITADDRYSINYDLLVSPVQERIDDNVPLTGTSPITNGADRTNDVPLTGTSSTAYRY